MLSQQQPLVKTLIPFSLKDWLCEFIDILTKSLSGRNAIEPGDISENKCNQQIAGYLLLRTHLQNDTSGWLEPRVDLVPTRLAAEGPLL